MKISAQGMTVMTRYPGFAGGSANPVVAGLSGSVDFGGGLGAGAVGSVRAGVGRSLAELRAASVSASSSSAPSASPAGALASLMDLVFSGPSRGQLVFSGPSRGQLLVVAGPWCLSLPAASRLPLQAEQDQ